MSKSTEIPLFSRNTADEHKSSTSSSKDPAPKRSPIQFRRQVSRGSLDVSGVFGGDSALRMEPIAALAPLMDAGEKKVDRPDSTIKSVPAFAPYMRDKRNRSIGLIRINDFRHWWKLSRLLVRLAGLYVYTQDEEVWERMVGIKIMKAKGPKKALKLIKRLGQGGPVRAFLKDVQPFTRFIRIVVAAWRYFEASKCRRTEVGVEEAMAFVGNRVSRYLARDAVDALAAYIVIPVVQNLIENGYVDKHDWHPATVFVILGVMRAVSPFAASFQGSRLGRVLTRGAFHAGNDRWMTIMRVNDINLTSDDCCEGDEVNPSHPNADLVMLAKRAAVALGKDSSNPDPSPRRATKYMEDFNFRQIGCGSGGYAVYTYREQGMTVLLHVTPYGPAVFDELPRYVVLERETSIDTRGNWSDELSQFVFAGSPVVEGYCYKGAFFSPYQFAALKSRYDEELLAYANACKLMCASSKRALPPTDLASLKAFLEMGRPKKKINKHIRREKVLQATADKLCQHIKTMMSQRPGGFSRAPEGVILYFEGLDCAGKSSSGRFVQQALERAGYNVEQRRHNKPPTAEDLKRPWMARFDRPDIEGKSSATSMMVTMTQSAMGYGTISDIDEETPLRRNLGENFQALVWVSGDDGYLS
jgi:hypothetical protein